MIKKINKPIKMIIIISLLLLGLIGGHEVLGVTTDAYPLGDYYGIWDDYEAAYRLGHHDYYDGNGLSDFSGFWCLNHGLQFANGFRWKLDASGTLEGVQLQAAYVMSKLDWIESQGLRCALC